MQRECGRCGRVTKNFVRRAHYRTSPWHHPDVAHMWAWVWGHSCAWRKACRSAHRLPMVAAVWRWGLAEEGLSFSTCTHLCVSLVRTCDCAVQVEPWHVQNLSRWPWHTQTDKEYKKPQQPWGKWAVTWGRGSSCFYCEGGVGGSKMGARQTAPHCVPLWCPGHSEFNGLQRVTLAPQLAWPGPRLSWGLLWLCHFSNFIPLRRSPRNSLERQPSKSWEGRSGVLSGKMYLISEDI